MAAIDFPASPTTGQLFSAANGVSYIWNGTLWLTQAGPGGGTGDFCATSPTGTFSTLATVIPLTVVSGNAGSVYSTSTGRYTPPAGRYAIYGAISGFNAGSAVGPQLQLRKNGTAVVTNAGSATAGNVAEVVVSGTFDANGTDYFDIAASAGVAITYFGSGATFSAFPLTGMQGPQGPAGPDSKLLQSVSFETGAMATGTTIIPVDDTIPQISEGNEYMTCSITPKSATSKLVIDVVWSGANSSAAATLVAALFQDSTANALAAMWQAYSATNAVQHIKFTHTMMSGTTSATTFRVRAGSSIAGTTTFNGVVAGRIFGGVMASSIMVREEAP